jgi:hypothetical protein
MRTHDPELVAAAIRTRREGATAAAYLSTSNSPGTSLEVDVIDHNRNILNEVKLAAGLRCLAPGDHSRQA